MVNFENGVTPINDTNLNKAQTDLQEEMKIKVVTGQEVATNEYIDDKRVYRKRVTRVWGSENNLEIPCGLSGTSYNQVKFEAFLKGTTNNLFNINTPRADGTNVDGTQTWGYWNGDSDKFFCYHMGYTREGSTVYVDLYYTKN